MSRCPHCEAHVLERNKFCKACGGPLSSGSSVPATSLQSEPADTTAAQESQGHASPSSPGDGAVEMGQGRYSFVATGGDALGLMFTNLLLTLFTFGLAAILGFTRRRTRKWIATNITVDGQRLRFQKAPLGDAIGHSLTNRLLTLFTLGLATPWVAARDLRFERRMWYTPDGRRFDFDGSGGDIFGLTLMSFFGRLLTLNMAGPWLDVMKERWVINHTGISPTPQTPQGLRLRFDGTPLSYLFHGMIAKFLTYITLGIYSPWALVAYQRWLWQATSDSQSPRVRVPVGPQSAGQWAAIGAIGVAWLGIGIFLLMSLLSFRSRDSDGARSQGVSSSREVSGSRTSSTRRGRGAREGEARARERAARRQAERAARRRAEREREARRRAEARGEGTTPVDLTRLYLSTVRASSELRTGRTVYRASKAADGDRGTAWGARRGQWEDEWLELVFTRDVSVSKVRVLTGYCHRNSRSGIELFPANRRVKRARIVVGSAAPIFHDFRDDPAWQTVTVSPPQVGRMVRFTVLDIYQGNRWPDLHVSEIAAWGTVAR